MITDLEAPRIGELAASGGIVLHELTPQLASLEEAFMELTADSVEFGAHRRRIPCPPRREGSASDRARHGSPPPGQPGAGPPGPASATWCWPSGRRSASVRSTVWSLLLLVVLTIGFTALFTALTVASWDKADAGQRAADHRRPGRLRSSARASAFGQLTICVLGVLVITSEYSTGVIRASLLAVPKRFPMLAAKIVVFAVLVIVIGEIVAFCSFFVGSAILHSKVPVSLSDPGVLRAVVGGGLYLAVLGLFALAVGGAHPAHRRRHQRPSSAFVLVLAPLGAS